MSYHKKNISFSLDTSDLEFNGEMRSFSVSGDEGAVFSVEVYDDAAGSPTLPRNYYNFTTNTWSSTKSRLSNVQLTGDYSFSVIFPTVEFTDTACAWNTGTDPTITHSDLDGKIVAGMTVTGPSTIPAGATVGSVTDDTHFELSLEPTGGAASSQTLTFAGIRKYTIDIHAETVGNISTKHSPHIEIRDLANAVSLNKSSGSNSNLLRKIIYQDIKKNLYLSCIAPSLTTAGTDEVVASFLSTRVVITNDDATNPRVVQVGDKITSVTVAGEVPATAHVLVTKINPDGDNAKEIEINISDDITDTHPIRFTPAFNGITPNGVVDTTGQQAFEASSGESFRKFFSITCTAPTGRTLSASRLPTTKDLCAYTTVTFEAAALALEGEDTASATKFFRWPITNIAKLQDGMILDPARPLSGGTAENTTTPTTISKYTTTKTILESIVGEYHTEVNEVTVEDVRVNAVDAYGNAITAIDRNGAVTARKGNITFNVQQLDALKADAGVRIFGYGAQKIKSLTGMGVAISDVVITPTQVSTATSSAVSGSATIPLDEVGNISAGMTIRGIGVNTSTAIPTVVVKAEASTAGDITASAVQTIEDNRTLYFDGASNILTITGVIEISNMSIDDTTLYIDVEKFIDVH